MFIDNFGRINLILACFFLLYKADDVQEALTAFGEDTADRQLLLNVEYKGANTDHVFEPSIFQCFHHVLTFTISRHLL